MYELKTNTAVRIPVGPLVDPTDGKTAETGLTVTGMSVEIFQMKNDGNAVVRAAFAPTASNGDNDMVHVTSDTTGMYDLELTAAQLNWLGNGRIAFYDVDGFLVHWIDILVVSAAYFDWKYGTTIPDVNTTKIGGTSQTAGDVVADVAAIHVHVGDILEDTGTTLPATLTTIGGYIDTEVAEILTRLPDATAGATGGLSIVGSAMTLTSGTITSIAAAIWNYLTSAMTAVSSIGKALAEWLAAIPAGTSTFGATDLVLCNNALMMLGNEAVANLTDTAKKGVRLCTQFYQQAVDEALRAYTWNCALARVALTVDATAPAWGYSYRFELPSDCLRVVGMDEASYNYTFKIENGYLLTDEATCNLLYIKRITPDAMDVLLRKTVSARLASLIAFPLTNSTSLADAMFKLYKDCVQEAETVDAFEGTSEQLVSDDWTNSRN